MQVLNGGTYIGKVVAAWQGNGVIAGTTVYYNDEANGLMHSHENPHISFVFKGGNIDKRQNGSKEKPPGSISFFHSGEPHQTIQKIFPAQHINLELEARFLKEYLLGEAEIKECITTTPDAKFFLLKVYHELLQNDSYSKPSIDILLLDLLKNHQSKEKKQPSWVSQLDELLRAKWDETIELNDLSLIIGVHPVTISKNFRKYFACTFGEYMRKLKVEKAITLIKSESGPLTQVAYQCGFADQSHFTRIFLQYTGFHPHHYKKLQANPVLFFPL